MQEVMDALKATSDIYQPFAYAAMSVYFLLENMTSVSPLYQYSLPFFQRLVQAVLAADISDLLEEDSSSSPESRVGALIQVFFEETARRVLRGLRHEDQSLFILRLVFIASKTHGLEHSLSSKRSACWQLQRLQPLRI